MSYFLSLNDPVLLICTGRMVTVVLETTTKKSKPLDFTGSDSLYLDCGSFFKVLSDVLASSS